METIAGAVATLEEALKGFEPARLSGAEAMAAVGVLARAERLCAAAKARAAAPVEACGSQRATAAWLAQASGTSVREASAALATASAVEGLAATREAFVAGRLSAAQAAAV